jgi:hypothetical protein
MPETAAGAVLRCCPAALLMELPLLSWDSQLIRHEGVMCAVIGIQRLRVDLANSVCCSQKAECSPTAMVQLLQESRLLPPDAPTAEAQTPSWEGQINTETLRITHWWL